MTEVHFINVGYGDAALVLQKEADGQKFAMLIDCGGETVGTDDPAGFRTTAADYLKTLGVRYINVVLLSHLHLDHSGGILAIAQNFTVGELWTSYAPHPSLWEGDIPGKEALDPGPANLVSSLGIYTRALRILHANHTAVHTVTAGFSKTMPAGELRILAGRPALYARQASILDRVFAEGATNAPLRELDGFINNTSLRAQLHASDVIFLFAGDISASEWEREGIPQADVVKIPHHGHADSLNEIIAGKLNARYAVFSVSNTRTDRCPNPGIIKKLERAGACVLFTDAVRTARCPNGRKHRSLVFRIGVGASISSCHLVPQRNSFGFTQSHPGSDARG